MKEILISPKNERQLQEIEAILKSIGVEFTVTENRDFWDTIPGEIKETVEVSAREIAEGKSISLQEAKDYFAKR
jgi:inosine/xanthosine triphosphate pyrophosphatase family protein